MTWLDRMQGVFFWSLNIDIIIRDKAAKAYMIVLFAKIVSFQGNDKQHSGSCNLKVVMLKFVIDRFVRPHRAMKPSIRQEQDFLLCSDCKTLLPFACYATVSLDLPP